MSNVQPSNLSNHSSPPGLGEATLGDAAVTGPFKDHRALGKEMKLFMPMDVAPGAPLLLENGVALYKELSSIMSGFLHEMGGFHEVRTPALVDAKVWERSGHLEKFRENMYLFQDEGGTLRGLKPMNCPLHMMVFGSTSRSYRELPYRIHDEGILHRNENSGSLHGMARLSQFHQDDTHIFISANQLDSEMDRILGMVDRLYKAFGFEYRVKLSTRPKLSLGDDALWEQAEGTLARVLRERKVHYQIDAGGGAFYGPKIDVDIKDASGKWWQVATTQLDYNLPERFDLHFVNSSGQRERPIVLHSAMYGAIERFMAIYIEHVQGKFPLPLAPVQVAVYPVQEAHASKAQDVSKALRCNGFRVFVDDRPLGLSSRIRETRTLRAPYTIVIGDQELQSETISVTPRDSKHSVQQSLTCLIERLKEEDRFIIP